jgi:hypothetical protein
MTFLVDADVHAKHVELSFKSGACDQCQGNCAICPLDVPSVEPQSWTERAAAHTLPVCAVGGVITDHPDLVVGTRVDPGVVPPRLRSQLLAFRPGGRTTAAAGRTG